MERADGSFRRVENYETAVNKGHHNVSSYPLRYCDFSPMLFLHLYDFLKLFSSKLWLFLEFDCLKYCNGNGKVRKVLYERISDITMLTVIRVKTWFNINIFR